VETVAAPQTAPLADLFDVSDAPALVVGNNSSNSNDAAFGAFTSATPTPSASTSLVDDLFASAPPATNTTTATTSAQFGQFHGAQMSANDTSSDFGNFVSAAPSPQPQQHQQHFQQPQQQQQQQQKTLDLASLYNQPSAQMLSPQQNTMFGAAASPAAAAANGIGGAAYGAGNGMFGAPQTTTGTTRPPNYNINLNAMTSPHAPRSYAPAQPAYGGMPAYGAGVAQPQYAQPNYGYTAGMQPQQFASPQHHAPVAPLGGFSRVGKGM